MDPVPDESRDLQAEDGPVLEVPAEQHTTVQDCQPIGRREDAAPGKAPAASEEHSS